MSSVEADALNMAEGGGEGDEEEPTAEEEEEEDEVNEFAGWV